MPALEVLWFAEWPACCCYLCMLLPAARAAAPLPADLVEKLAESAEDMSGEMKAVHSKLEWYRCGPGPATTAATCPSTAPRSLRELPQLPTASIAILSPAAATALRLVRPPAGTSWRACCAGSAPMRSFMQCR